MRVLIFHALLELTGGSGKLALELSKALNELGYNIKLITFYRDLDALERSINLLTPNYRPNIIAKPVPTVYNFLDLILSERLVRFKRLILTNSFLKKLQKSDCDLLFDTDSNVPLDVDISYIHYPTVAPGYGKGIIYKFYNLLVKHYSKLLEGTPKLVLTNSSWTANNIITYYPKLSDRVYVLHPPVDVEYFNDLLTYDKERLVITVSRFTPEKNLGEVLKVAKVLRSYDFLLVGSASKYSEPVIKYLRTRIESENLNNVELKVNVSRDELRKLLSRAKYYLHPPFPEHFGISVVEAMAAGCIPIVYRDGGIWYDIVNKVSDILGYRDINEVPNIIEWIDHDKDLYITLRNRSIETSKTFNYERFKSSLSKWVSHVVKIKKLTYT
jgi:glycosyltransferase involved in cell wall biosynthesis